MQADILTQNAANEERPLGRLILFACSDYFITEMIEKTIRPTPQIAAAISSFLTDGALFSLGKRYFSTAAKPAIEAIMASTGPLPNTTTINPMICARLKMRMTM